MREHSGSDGERGAAQRYVLWEDGAKGSRKTLRNWRDIYKARW